MFSILNEIKDNRPFRTTSVVTASIGTAGGIYILVAITGYLSFGDNVVGNIVSQCKLETSSCQGQKLIFYYQTFRRSHLRSARQQSSFLSCSPTLYKSTRVVRRLMQSSNGDQASRAQPSRHQVMVLPREMPSCQRSRANRVDQKWARRGSLPSPLQSSS